MKNLLVLITFLFVIFACNSTSNQDEYDRENDLQNKGLPKIAIAGIAIESSTFSPAQTVEEAFHARYKEGIYYEYPFLSDNTPLRTQAEWFPTVRGHALPGGIVTREAYESLVGKTLKLLEENLPYDGLFFDIHGAMSVVGLDDPEGDFIIRVREVVGEETLISTSMDLHGNVSKRLAENTDLITCFRMAPHEDAMDSKKRAVQNLVDRIESGKGKPKFKAWIPVPILLPGEKTSTRIEPAKSLYAMIEPATQKEGIIDAAIWVGYAWADEPRNHAVVMVVGDDKNLVTQEAEKIAQYFWNVRSKFEFVAATATLKESIDMAVKSNEKPFIISDMGDNPTAGGAGDVTWTLKEILNRPEFKKANGPSVIYASIPGPELVAKAIEAGVGGKVSAFAGAAIDDRYAPPIKLTGIVESIEHGDQHAETEVVIKVGSVHVIVTKKRKPYHKEVDFTHLGLNPRETDIVVVKIGYLVPELYDMRKGWIMALTPGGVDQDLERLDYKRIIRPMYPLDKDMAEPDLTAQFISLSNELENIKDWIYLFDGTSTKGWRAYNGESLPPQWVIKDNTLTFDAAKKPKGVEHQGGNDIIYADEEFDNFELYLEWKIPPGGNSGIFYHVKEGYEGPPSVSPEYQLIDDENYTKFHDITDYNKGLGYTENPEDLKPLQQTASDYAMYYAEPEGKLLNPAGEWNTTKIIFTPEKVEHWLNGKMVVSFVPWSDDWNKKKNSGKWGLSPDYGKFKSGYIGLQDHDSALWFRNIKIRRL